MKLLLFIVMMISGVLGANSVQADQQIDVAEGVQVIQPIVSEAPPLAAAVISIEGETAGGSGPENNASSGCGAESISAINSVGGVSLYDTPESVVSKLGEPEKIERDEIWPELELYYYPSVHVAFYGEQVQYVDVPIAEHILINGKSVPMSEEGLKACLGEPDFTAEDGIVFQKEEALLKLFFEEGTRQPIYASYYHIATV